MIGELAKPEWYLHHKKKSPTFIGLNMNWRRGRDSNSGRGRPLDGFQDRCIKPLCHLSRGICDLRKTFTQIPPKRQALFFSFVINFYKYPKLFLTKQKICPRIKTNYIIKTYNYGTKNFN